MPKRLLCVRLHALLLIACCCLFRTSSAQFTRLDFTGRKHASIAAIDDFLYIHGGEPSNKDDNKYYDTLVIHLKDKWPANSPTIAPMNWATSAVQMLGHRVWGFQLWKMPGTKSLLSWGGFRTTNTTVGRSDDYPGDAPLSRDLFVLATDSRGVANWSPEKAAADPAGRTLTQAGKANEWGPGMGYSVSCAGYGIYLGGVAAQPTSVNGTPPPFGGTWSAGSQLQGGLVTYEIATKKWTNATVPPDTFPAGGVAGGSAVCVPQLGERGLVLFLGGHANRPGSDLGAGGGGVGSALSLGRLVFYDPVKKEWLSQAATGDVPPERRHFCAVGVRSAPHGRNSTEVYVFGGDVAGSSPGPAGDLYVLSLPAMNWWRVLHGQAGLSGHACEVVGRRQLVVLGGQGRNGTAAAAAPSANMGIRIFDMGTQNFVQDYSPAGDPYESPSYIKTWYSDGNLDRVNWNNDRVKATMLQIPDSSNNSDPAKDTAKDTTKEPGNNTAAIVGGAVGGAVALLLTGVAAWLLARRRRRNRSRYNAVDTAAAPSTTTSDDKGGRDDGPAAAFPYKPELDSSPAAARSELASTHGRTPELHSAAVSSSATAVSSSPWPPKSPAPWTAASEAEADSRAVHEMLAQVPGAELQGSLARAELPGN
ncbi:hypothetical protein RB597_000990 [Gaeumannomyces tritici]